MRHRNAPRALAVAGGRLFVAAFESNDQTERPGCSPTDSRDPVGLDSSFPVGARNDPAPARVP